MKNRAFLIITLLLVIILFFVSELGQNVSGSKIKDNRPASNRISNESSNYKYSEGIDKKINSFLKRWDLNGASLAIVKDGRLVYAKGYGYADIENSKPVEPSNLFRLASVSKLLTATAVMKLQEKGKLSLDNKVFGENGILNDSTYSNIKYKRYKEITVEQLLRHKGGFTTRIKDPLFRPLYVAKTMNVEPPANLETTIKYQLTQKLAYKPGKRISYSNLGYGILSKVIEKVSDMSYEEYVKQNILAPCGIYNMHIGNNFPEDKYPDEVCYYEQDDSEKILACDGSNRKVFKCNGGNNVHALEGAGGWIGTASEMLKFVTSIDGDENKPDIISKKSVKYMTKKIKGELPIGWMKIDYKNNWWRTGTLAGSTILLKKQSNGISWIMVFNTSSWRGSKFPKTINRAITRIIRKIKEWPSYDLFYYYNTKPLVIDIKHGDSEHNTCS